MKQKLLSLVFMLSAFYYADAQTISIIGGFNNWDGDVVMDTTDNENYTLTAFTFAVSGDVKFRENLSWDVSWGANDFPSGIANTNNAPNIPVPAGTYDVAFNRITGAYSFTDINDFDDIGFIGGFNNWSESVPMITLDGEDYSKLDFYFNEPEVKFRKDNSWDDSWGGDSFPIGTAVLSGAALNIPLTVGFYNVFFNSVSLEYEFETVPVSIIGPAVLDYDTEIMLSSDDNGISFTAENVTLNSGELKFRSNSSWTLNWGGTTFPSGVGAPNNIDETPIDVVAGTYDISFNRLTLAYNFATSASVDSVVANKFTVYPNPSDNLWNIVSSQGLIEKVILMDVSGKIIQNYEPKDTTFSIQNTELPKGLYFAKIISDNSEQVVKLAKR